MVVGCVSSEPESEECITAYDCEEGYTCINYVCVEITDGTVVADRDTAFSGETVGGTEGEAGEIGDEAVTMAEEDSADSVIDTILADDAPEITNDANETEDDAEIDGKPEQDQSQDEDEKNDLLPDTDLSPVNECLTMNNPCNDNGDTNATCTDTLGGYTCNCSGGFTFSGGTCQDINECATANGGCAQICTNSVGSYACSCTSGYTLNADGKNCDDINECETQNNPCDNNGDTGATCTNTAGSYTCICSWGFEPAGGSCVDINECTWGTHTCDAHATCTNTVGGFTCACNAYYTGNGTTCTFCNSDLQCDAACAACGGGTPYCKDNGNGTTQCVQCRTDGDCTSGYVCNAAGQCVQPVPPESCTTGNQSRDRCSNARIIGRSTAKTSSGYTISDDTCYANNRVDQSSGCWDAGADHTYKIYLRAGERAVITLSTSWACPSYNSTSWDATLAIYNDASCSSSARVWCDDYFEGTTTYTAPADGWYIIVVDGSTAFDDEGDYTLTVKLQNCVSTGCNCP